MNEYVTWNCVNARSKLPSPNYDPNTARIREAIYRARLDREIRRCAKLRRKMRALYRENFKILIAAQDYVEGNNTDIIRILQTDD